jgi:Fe-S-cluster-containing dehydrogenase component
MDPVAKVMKKCTLCVDRIYNDNIPEVDRVPSCVRTCPANARHFGDFADTDSAVSKMTAERGGFELMPEMATKPVNRYLPPRPKAREVQEAQPNGGAQAADGFLGWLDRALERLG